MTRATTGLVLAAALIGCGQTKDAGDRGVSVVATTTHAADLVRNVAGPRAEVRALLSPNADPHNYEPRPSDARALAGADLVVRSGGEVDEWLGDLADAAGATAPTLVLLEAVERRGDDPHWWHDPRNAPHAVEAIADALARADPRGADGFRRRARLYSGRLRLLDRRLATCFARVPASRRKLVTTHRSLGYLAHRYDLDVVGAVIPSQSSEAQASARDTERLVRRIRREGVSAIFPEPSLEPRLERAVAREAGVRLGKPLWGDTLGPPGSDGATFLEATAANARSLVEGMTGGRLSCEDR